MADLEFQSFNVQGGVVNQSQHELLQLRIVDLEEAVLSGANLVHHFCDLALLPEQLDGMPLCLS